MSYVERDGLTFAKLEGRSQAARETWKSAFPGQDLSIIEAPTSLRDLPLGPELRSYSSPPSEQIADWFAGGLRGLGADPYRSNNFGKGVATVLGFTPLGIPMAVGDAAHALVHGDYWGAGLAALPMMLPLGVVARGLTRGVGEGAKLAGIGSAAADDFAGHVSALPASRSWHARSEATTANAQPYARYADEYPANGPPRLFDKETLGPISYNSMDEANALVEQRKAFWRKSLAPESKMFAQERRAIQRDLDKHGYDPAFDPALRADVDPRNYPSRVDLSQTMPSRPETTERIREFYRTNGALDRILDAYNRGKDLPNAINWSAIKQIEDQFVAEYGAREGRDRFVKEFVRPIAATTAGNSPTQNLLFGHYVAFKQRLGEMLPRQSRELPYPIGGQFGRSNLRIAQRNIDNGNAGFHATNPKRYSFERAMLGDRDAWVIDSRISRAIDPNSSVPEYYALAAELLEEARKRVGAKDAREFNDAVWAGLDRMLHGQMGHNSRYRTLIDEINDAVERTHRLTGMPREDIVRRIVVRKEGPLYGLAGAPLFPMIDHEAIGPKRQDGSSLQNNSL